MAATIKIKNSSTAGTAPTASDLVQGELAVNVTDKRLFTENASGTVVELGTNPSTLTVTAGATIQGLTVGRGAGAVSTNTAVGASALAANTTGSTNTAVGNQAMALTTTGTASVAVGLNAAYSNTTGSSNTALGQSALFSNTTASNNTAVGYQSLYSNTTGQENTVVGFGAADANTTGREHVAMGNNALGANTTGSYNVAIGKDSLGSNTTASYNTSVGYQAGNAATGANNTYIGAQAGISMTTGASNTILGRFGGNSGGLDIRTASNYIVLSDGDGNPRFYGDSNGFFTMSGPSNSYAIAGNVGSTNYFVSGSYAQIYGGSNQYYACKNLTGGVYLNGTSATSWTAASDERLKENLTPIENGLSKVCSLRSVIGNYTFDEDKVKKPFLIAQDVQAVLPEAVTSSVQSKDDPTEYLGVAYTEVIPLLVAAIKELKAEIDTLKGQA